MLLRQNPAKPLLLIVVEAAAILAQNVGELGVNVRRLFRRKSFQGWSFLILRRRD